MSQTTLFIEGSLHRTTTVRPVGRVLLKGKFVCSSGNRTCELAFNSISGYLVFYWIKTKIFFYGSFNSKSRLLIIWLVVWSPPQPIKCHWTMTLRRQIAPSLFVFCGKNLSCIGQKSTDWIWLTVNTERPVTNHTSDLLCAEGRCCVVSPPFSLCFLPVCQRQWPNKRKNIEKQHKGRQRNMKHPRSLSRISCLWMQHAGFILTKQCRIWFLFDKAKV